MDPSNFSKACADALHQTNLDRLAYNGAQLEVRRKYCGHVDSNGAQCPYWAWLVGREVRDGRWLETYICDDNHTNYSFDILSV